MMLPMTGDEVNYDEFNKILREEYGLIVETGCFGEHMYLDVLCDGPVTINLEI